MAKYLQYINLKSIDLFMLSLMIISLPSLEAPKNIFLVGYLITRALSEILKIKEGLSQWGYWDSLFLIIVSTALLSTLFSGFSGFEEWRGYKVFLTEILMGWLLSRAHYSKNQYRNFFKLIVIGTLPPLIFGFYEYFVLHKSLQLYSVGHVNHSAIYLVMIFGSSFGWFLSQFTFRRKISEMKWQLVFTSIFSLVFFFSLIIGQSRGAFGIGFILGLSLIFLLGKNRIIKTLGTLSFISILIIMTISQVNIIQKQITNQSNKNTLAYRAQVWNVSLEASRFYPLLGIGMSNWHFISLEHLKKSVEKRNGTFKENNYYFPGHSHNLYLTALVERGVIGLAVTFFFMLTWIRQLTKTFFWAKKTKEATYLWAGSFGAWLATFGIGFVNTTFHHEHGILACLFLGLYLSYTHYHLKK